MGSNLDYYFSHGAVHPGWPPCLIDLFETISVKDTNGVFGFSKVPKNVCGAKFVVVSARLLGHILWNLALSWRQIENLVSFKNEGQF